MGTNSHAHRALWFYATLTIYVYFKVAVSQDLAFFFLSNPSEPLIHRLKRIHRRPNDIILNDIMLNDITPKEIILNDIRPNAT